MSVHFFDNVKSDRTIFEFLWKDKFLPLLKLIADTKLKTIVTYNYPGNCFDLLGLLLGNIRQIEQKPGGRGGGREYNNLPFKMHCDSIIMRSCWIVD